MNPPFSFRAFLHGAFTFATALGGMLISSCVHKPPPPPPPAPDQPKPLYEWSAEGRRISHMTIDIDDQKVYVFSGRDQIAWATVATGIFKYPTPVGSFKVLEKTASKMSNLYGKMYDKDGKCINSDAKLGRDPIPEGGRFDGAKMPYYMRLTGDGVGMHAGPIPKPGYRASHGCIRMPRAFAPKLFAVTPIGTPVAITGNGPSYSSYLAKQHAAAAKLAAAKAQAAKEADAKKAQGDSQPIATGADAAPNAPAANPAAAPANAATTPSATKEPALEVKPAVVPNGADPKPLPGQ